MTIAAPNPAGWTPRPRAGAEPVAPAEDDLPEGPAVDWTAAEDLALAEALTAVGGGLDAAARRCGRGRGACLRRWRALLPQVGTEAQERLLRRLRAEVESGDAPLRAGGRENAACAGPRDAPLRAGPARPFRRG